MYSQTQWGCTLQPNGSFLKANGGTLKANGGILEPNVGTLKPNVGTLKANGGTLKPNGGTLKANGGTIVKPNGGILKANLSILNGFDGFCRIAPLGLLGFARTAIGFMWGYFTFFGGSWGYSSDDLMTIPNYLSPFIVPQKSLLEVWEYKVLEWSVTIGL